MKKILSLTLVFALVVLPGCSNQNKIALVPETKKMEESTTEQININEETKKVFFENNEILNQSQNENIEINLVKNNDRRNDMKPEVYFTKEITADSLVKIYEKLGWSPEGNVGVKISTGEPPRSNYLRAELIGDLVKKVNGTIIECNTAYGGDRSKTAMHKQVAKDHGYTDIAEVDIMDEDGDMDIPVTGGNRLTRLITGDHIKKI